MIIILQFFPQTQVSGVSTNTILRNLQPDTGYTITVVPVYSDMEGKRQSEKGKTSMYQSNISSSYIIAYHIVFYIKSIHAIWQYNIIFYQEPLGGVKNLQVTDPTTSSLRVRWEPAEGNVRQYRLFYVPTTGGAEDMVRYIDSSVFFFLSLIVNRYLSR